MAHMKIQINGQIKDINKETSLASLIQEVASKPDKTIAEINGQIVQATDWQDVLLQENDKLELVSFVGGG